MRLSSGLFVIGIFLAISNADPIYNQNIRSKRSYRLDANWPDNCVPYVLDPTNADITREIAHAYMKVVEKNTCLRFFHKATNTTDHSSCAPTTTGYVYITQAATGSSQIGYGSNNGQVMTITTGEKTTVHEFVHLLGSMHEIHFGERTKYLNVMIDNVGPSHRSAFGILPGTNHYTCEWSMQSSMMFTQTVYSWHGYNMFNLHFVNTGDLYDIASSFYTYKDISINHKCCGETYCTSLTCGNEGYKGSYRDTCQCICPAGFDSAFNCEEIQTSRITTSQWPSGVSSLAPRSGCPDTSFKTGVRFSNTDGSVSSDNHLAIIAMENLMALTFCTKDDDINTNDKWEPGNYCILKSPGFDCEANSFESGSFTVNDDTTDVLFLTGTYGMPSGAYGLQATYDICCRSDGITGNALSLPNDKAFTLLKTKNSPCQAVEGMNAKQESFSYSQVTFTLPTGTMLDYEINIMGWTWMTTVEYCYYEPLTYNCGGIYTLTANEPSHVFSSPNHPSPYGSNAYCTWAFIVEAGSTIQLQCSGSIDIADTDDFTIRKKTFGEKGVSPVLTPTGRFMPMLSISNKLAVSFRSGQNAVSNSGFTCTATLADEADKPYSNLRNGEDYCGVMNYAVNELGFHHCLPWADVFEDNGELFGDIEIATKQHCPFEDNYCRNVGGTKMGPVCATSLNKKNVTLFYCDTAQYVSPFDLLDDCQTALTMDPECTDSETVRTCFLSCVTNGKITDYPTKEPAASAVSCSEPTLAADVTNNNYNAGGYAVGTKITMKCTQSQDERELMCLSNGEWSTETNFCTGCSGEGCSNADGACPAGYDERGGNCYKLIYSLMKGIDAKTRCHDENAYLACPANDADFVALQNYYSEYIAGSGNKMWVGAEPNTLGNAWYCENTGTQMIGPYWSKFIDTGPTGSIQNLHITWMLHDTHAKYPRKLARTELAKNNAYPVCQKGKEAAAPACVDTRTDCAALININPKLRDYTAFALKYCQRTAGVCEATVTSFCFVSTGPGVSVDMTFLVTGHYATYSCKAGYRHDGTGNKYRACLADGTATGTEIICNPDSESTRQLNYIPIQDDPIVIDANLIMTGKSPAYLFTESASVLACRAYCKEDGDITLQIWKQTPNGEPKDLTLVHQRDVSCIGRRAVTWEFTSPVSVTNGDFLGVLDTKGGVIPLHNCYRTQNLDKHNEIRFAPFDPQEGLVVGNSYVFDTRPSHYHPWYPRCYVYSVDCIVKPDTMTGPATIQFNN